MPGCCNRRKCCRRRRRKDCAGRTDPGLTVRRRVPCCGRVLCYGRNRSSGRRSPSIRSHSRRGTSAGSARGRRGCGYIRGRRAGTPARPDTHARLRGGHPFRLPSRPRDSPGRRRRAGHRSTGPAHRSRVHYARLPTAAPTAASAHTALPVRRGRLRWQSVRRNDSATWVGTSAALRGKKYARVNCAETRENLCGFEESVARRGHLLWLAQDGCSAGPDEHAIAAGFLMVDDERRPLPLEIMDGEPEILQVHAVAVRDRSWRCPPSF